MSAQNMADKLGIGSAYRQMIVSGVSELARLDFITLAYAEMVKENRIQMIASLLESRAKSGCGRGLLVDQISAILTDSRYYRDS